MTTGVLIRKRQKGQSQEVEGRGGTATSRGTWVPLEAKRRETTSP